MPQEFKDHFSAQAATYTQFRPHYPADLFDWLASVCSKHEHCWDCATGNGQAAHGLADHFAQISATDASASQIAQAKPHPRVAYSVATAEASGLDSQCVDLITVAQAAHWFDHEKFFGEVNRVLRPDGIVALWAYEIERVTPEIDAIFDELYSEILDGYWPPERRHIESGYRTIPFPFERIHAPAFDLSVEWSIEQQLGYYRSWSSTNRYIRENGSDPILLIEGKLRDAWGDKSRKVQWPLVLLVGKANS